MSDINTIIFEKLSSSELKNLKKVAKRGYLKNALIGGGITGTTLGGIGAVQGAHKADHINSQLKYQPNHMRQAMILNTMRKPGADPLSKNKDDYDKKQMNYFKKTMKSNNPNDSDFALMSKKKGALRSGLAHAGVGSLIGGAAGALDTALARHQLKKHGVNWKK